MSAFQINNEYLMKYTGPGGEVEVPEGILYIARDAFANCAALTAVKLPQSLVHIYDRAFLNCTGLTEIVIPDNVQNLWNNAFCGCTALERVHLGKKAQHLFAGVFALCDSLREFTVDPENPHFQGAGCLLLSKDGKTVIRAATGITGEYCVPDGVEKVKMCAFEGCNKLTAIRFAPSVTEIDYNAFSNCDELVRVEIPATVKTVSVGAFDKQARWGRPEPKLISEWIVSPEAGSVMASGVWLGPGTGPVCHPQLPFHFAGSKEDKQRMALGYIRNADKYSEEYAKGYLKYVKSQRKALLELAKKKKMNGVEEFYAALDAKPGAKPKKKAEEPVIAASTETPNPAEEFEIVDGLLVKYLGDAATVVVPDTVTKIGEKAFYGCKKLKKVVFPASVVHVAKKAFVTCPKLEMVILYGTEPKLEFNFHKFRETIDVIAPNASPAVVSADYRKRSVQSLAKAVANGTVKMPAKNGKLAGYLKRSNIQFYDVTEHDDAMLDLMIGLGAITGKEVPELLELWKDQSPERKLKLMALTQDAPVEDKLETALSGKAPTVAELKKEWTYGNMVFDKSFTGTETVKGITLKKYKGVKTEVEIPAYIGKTPVLEVGACAFENNQSITSVTIPETVFSIADRAFEGCRKLERVTHLGQKLKLSSWVFRDCGALSAFNTNAESLQNAIHPFAGCDRLFDADGFVMLDIGGARVLVDCKMPIQSETIVVPDGVTRIGNYAFGSSYGDQGRSNRMLKTVILPATLKHIDGSAFSSAEQLHTVQLPEGLESIGGSAFFECHSLEKIHIPASVKTIPNGAFYRCNNLTIHGKPGSTAETHATENKIPFVAE